MPELHQELTRGGGEQVASPASKVLSDAPVFPHRRGGHVLQLGDSHRQSQPAQALETPASLRRDKNLAAKPLGIASRTIYRKLKERD